MKRLPGIPKSRKGHVDPLDIYLVNELADRCHVNANVVIRAAEEMGKKATVDAVCRRALELRDAAAAKGSRRWVNRR